MAILIDGKKLSAEIKDEIKEKVNEYFQKTNRQITLAVILVGNDPASSVYVKNKIKATEYVGMKSLSYILPETATEEEIKELIITLANDDGVDGILVQLPLPKGINERAILDLIPAEKDVDGFKAENVGKLLLGEETTISCTPYGVITMLKKYGIELSGKNAVVVGRSNIVGKPMSILLLQENCTVTICHSKTENLKEITKTADILVSAIGKPNFIKEDMVKDGAVVIDVGINRTEEGIKGDVDFDNVSKKASYITPVPGGVGPMTISMLILNTLNSAKRRKPC
ncbi:MAG: bifunctional methylenetetrahydrofolate dehydrogenase/methenyltetrahydrofolate cyclohydrolase FolD [Clostridia bacterium]|nr:bifunctional methylenetetrahydrofolate dehydrogenase/methenyltetrahydrofolate cyclohydrolase FolD [Clostridia bacterium]